LSEKTVKKSTLAKLRSPEKSPAVDRLATTDNSDEPNTLNATAQNPHTRSRSERNKAGPRGSPNGEETGAVAAPGDPRLRESQVHLRWPQESAGTHQSSKDLKGSNRQSYNAV